MNLCKAAGRMPDVLGSMDHITTPIAKRGSTEHPIDASDPNDYRGITVGDTLMKLMGLVLLSRLTHQCSINGMLSSAQAGFQADLSADMHVATLLDAVTERRTPRSVTAMAIPEIMSGSITATIESAGGAGRSAETAEACRSAKGSSISLLKTRTDETTLRVVAYIDGGGRGTRQLASEMNTEWASQRDLRKQ